MEQIIPFDKNYIFNYFFKGMWDEVVEKYAMSICICKNK